MSGSDDSLCTIISCGALPFVAPVAFCPDASLVVRLVDIFLPKSSHTIFCFGGISIAKVQYVYLLRQIAVFVFILFTCKLKCKLWPKPAKINITLQWLHARMTESMRTLGFFTTFDFEFDFEMKNKILNRKSNITFWFKLKIKLYFKLNQIFI